MTHDYKRHGTTTLFAALNMATGEVIGKTYRKHRHQEVLMFLREVEKTVPKEQEIHIVLDNYATHKHEKVLAMDRTQEARLPPLHPDQRVLGQSGRAVLWDSHAKTDSSRCLYIGAAFGEVLARVLGELHENPRALVWTKSVEKILEKVRRFERSYPKPLNHYFVKDTTLDVAFLDEDEQSLIQNLGGPKQHATRDKLVDVHANVPSTAIPEESFSARRSAGVRQARQNLDRLPKRTCTKRSWAPEDADKTQRIRPSGICRIPIRGCNTQPAWLVR